MTSDAPPGGLPGQVGPAPSTPGAESGVPREWKGTDRSWGREAMALLPDLGRLLRALVADPRTPLRAKLAAGAAAAYVASPIGLLPGRLGGIGNLDDVVVVIVAVRHLVATAGYDLVRELWTGTDDGFTMLVVLAGVER